ncbi:MAG TPA: HepT-like ribonuclease domain-containing protein [Thermoanaerobaculia bacterium]
MACQLIREFTSGMTFRDYAEDRKTRSAVERQLEIVGEALGQMLRAFPEVQQEIPDASRIISFRNRLIHGYASVSNPVVWGILEGDLPGLTAKVEELLARGAGSL